MNNKILMIGVGIILVVLVGGAFIFGKDMASSGSTGVVPSSTPVVSSQPVGLANPASVNCEKVGGTSQIMNGPNGQYGLCYFEDDYACEEWALMRGECPVGGVRTTGFDTEAQKYCAWVGGQTLAVPDAQCTLPSGEVCPDEELIRGTCPSN